MKTENLPVLPKTDASIYEDLTGFEDALSAPIGKNSNKELHKIRDNAALIIQTAWNRFQMIKTYKWMKFNLYRTERMMSKEMLKRISPNEATLLSDPTSKTKIRFRFGGSSFPPRIMYKIYTSGAQAQYFSSYNIIFPGSKASEDSFNIMGSREYTHKIVLPDLQQKSSKIEKHYEVTDKLEYIQYVTSLDRKPPHLGGRNNDWRELNLSTFKDESVIYGDTKNYSWKRRNFRAIDKAYQIMDKYKNVKTKKYGGNRSKIQMEDKIPAAASIDDDFGMLLDWADHLDEENLTDYDVFDN